ncbi:MAG: ABC transporter permease [Micromonosporaceae bacterium]
MVGLLIRSRFAGDTLTGHARGGAALFLRNAYFHRSDLWIVVSGVAEPLVMLFALGFGMGQLVGHVPYAGGSIAYPLYVAPALLAMAAMTGALTESTFNVFAKLKFFKLYDAVLATPVTPFGIALGEIGWATLRSAINSASFVVVMALMGLTPSLWAIAAFPAAVLIGLAFSAAGMACVTYMRSWQEFDYISVTIFLLFLFSGTVAPLSAYPGWLQGVVTVTPLYHGVALVRALTTGVVTYGLLWHVAYLAGLSVLGFAVSGHRMRRLLMP